MSYITMKITPEIFKAALERSINLPVYKLNFKQHLQETGGELQAKLEGSLGEVVVEEWLRNNEINFEDDRANPTHDYSLKDGFTLEVKTKVRKLTPALNYECSIPEYTINMQTANLYIFLSLTKIKNVKLSIEKYPEAHIVGVISKKNFISKARYWKKGDLDPLNDFRVKENCYNVFISQMTPPSEFPEIYKGFMNRKSD
jgi:hypothetical protein